MNRVVITGMGVVSPLGNDLDIFREQLISGKSGIRALSLFPAENLPSRIAGECKIDNNEYKDRKIAFAIHAAESAIKDAEKTGIPLRQYHDFTLCGLSIGTGLELFDMKDMIRYSHKNYDIPDQDKGRPDFLQTPSDLCAHLITDYYGFKLPPCIHISACAAGNDAIGHAFLKIRRGEASMMLAGGTDSMINPLGMAGFCKLNALSTKNEEPEKASRPFDRERDGFVLGEGSGMLVLERLDHAVRRGAQIYAEINGYGNSFDAYTISDPHPEGRGAALAITRALKMAGIEPDQISYINAHGTSTPKNDPVETLAIKKVFGDRAYNIPISSTKSMTGHLISAAGAVEAIASIVCLNHGKIHPTINLENFDPACDLDYVPGLARDCNAGYFLSNAFAFGGQNSVIVFHNGENDA